MSSAISMELEAELEQELAMHEQAAVPYAEVPASAAVNKSHGPRARLASQVFYNHLAAMADRTGRSQALRGIALAAARRALRSYQPDEGIEGEGEGEAEFEGEFSTHEFLLEGELNPLRPAHGNALLEHLGHSAAEAETELEAAEQFLPAVPIAARMIVPVVARHRPAVARAAGQTIARAVPALTRAVGQVAGTLYRSPVARPLVRALPGIIKGTVADITRHVAHGQPITARDAVRTLARQTARQLSNPRHLVRNYRRSNARDRRYHHTVSRMTGVPVRRGSAAPAAILGYVKDAGHRFQPQPSLLQRWNGREAAKPAANVYTRGYWREPQPKYAIGVPTSNRNGAVCRCYCSR